MKALKTLLVVVMVMSLVVHPAFIDVLLAVETQPTDGNPNPTIPESGNVYAKVQDAIVLPPPPPPPPPAPEPDPALEEEGAVITAQIVDDSETTVDGKVISTTHQVTDYTYEYINGAWQIMKEVSNAKTTMADGGNVETTIVKTYSRDAKGVCTGVSQTCTGTSTAVSETGEKTTYTMQNYMAEFKFDEENGWYLANESYDWVIDDPSTTVPGTQLTPEEQNNYGVIFGTKPVTSKIVPPPDGVLDGPIVTNFYDKDGKLVGRMKQSLGSVQSFTDKDGKQIDVAAKINGVDNDTAGGVINSLNKETAEKILTDLEKINPTKATELRIKCGIDPDLSKLTPDQAADYLTKLNDPKRAAALLAKLDPVKAADIIASSKMSEGDAARILRKMDADKAAAILSARHPSEIDMGDGTIMAIMGEYGPVINAKKAAGILNNMSKTKAAAILGSDKMDKGVAGSVLNNFATYDAVKILNRMSAGKAAEILSKIDLYGGLKGLWLGGGLSKEKATEILSSMTAKRAAAIIGSDKMDNRSAATLMGALNVQKAVGILSKVADDKAAAILSCLAIDFPLYVTNSDASALTANSMIWPSSRGITAEQAGNILAGLKAEKAAGILASDNMTVETAGKILTEAKKTNEQAVNNMLTKLDGTNKVKADQIREKIGANPGTTLTAQEQENYKAIFGTAPVASKTRPSDPNMVGSPSITDFYDADGNLVGSMTQNFSTGYSKQTFLDKGGKVIDVAAKLNTVDATVAANVIKALDVETAASILSSSAISDQKAADILSLLGAEQAAGILVNRNRSDEGISTEKAAGILAAMTADKAAELISKIPSSGTTAGTTIAVGILAKLTIDRQAEILASSKMDVKIAAGILGNANMAVDRAVSILNSNKMSVDAAANILNEIALNEPLWSTGPNGEVHPTRVNTLLTALDAVNKVKADQIREKMGSATDITKMTADQAADYLTKLNDPKKAAIELAKLDANKAAAALNSSKMTSDLAAKIIGAMDENKVAEILSAQISEMRWELTNTPQGAQDIFSAWSSPILNAAKAAEILGKLETGKAASILSKVKMDTSVAAGIFSVMAPETAAKIMAKMDKEKAAGILTNVAVDIAVKIVSKMDIDTAVGVFSYDIMGTVSAANILYALKKTDEKKVTDIIAKLEATKPARAADIKGKLGIGSTDLSLMLPDIAVDYLIKLNDPAKAATELAKLDAVSAAKIIASGKMTTDLAAQILSKMDAAKAAEILSANSDLGWLKLAASSDANLFGVPFMGTNVIDAAKAAEILSKMTVEQAAAIIGNDKMDNATAAELMGKVDLQKAISILGKVSADKAAAILSVLKGPIRWLDYAGKTGNGVALDSMPNPFYWGKGLTPEQAGNILAGLGADKAAAILASKNMSVETAGTILTELNKTNAQAVTGMLAKLDAADKTKADLIRAKIGAINIGTMTPEAAAKYLSGLDPKAAAALLKTFIGNLYTNVDAAAAIVAKMDAAKAAAVLAELDAFDAGVIIGSANISVSAAMKIFSSMAADKAVAILATCDMGVSIDIMTTNGGLGGTALSLSSKKAADIFTAMISQAENALRGIMTAIDVDNAATIVSKMDPAAVKILFRQLISELDLPPGMSIPPQHPPFVTKEKAVAILASDNMSVDNAAKILNNFGFKDEFLAEMDKTDKVKADQIRTKIAAIDKSWLNDLGILKPEDAAAKIAAYVKDTATAKEVADALNKLEPFKAGQIIAQGNMTAQLAAQVFDQMTAQQVAGILNSSIVPIRFYDGADLVNCPPAYRVISYVKAAAILVAMDNSKAAAALAALPAYTAGNILFSQDTGNAEPAVANMKIIYLLRAMSADNAASIISAYCDPLSALKEPWLTNDMLAKPKAAIPARVEQIFRKMVPSESAPIFASDNMSVKTAARIISEVKKGFPDKANLILNAIDAVNPEKATWIRTVINVLEGNYVPGPFIVKFNAGVSDKAIAETLKSVSGKVESVHNIPSAGTFYVVSFPETISIVDQVCFSKQN